MPVLIKLEHLEQVPDGRLVHRNIRIRSRGERIRQIEAKAVRKLQQPSRSKTLASFLDLPFQPLADAAEGLASG